MNNGERQCQMFVSLRAGNRSITAVVIIEIKNVVNSVASDSASSLMDGSRRLSQGD